jgi:HSP20 family protein
MDQLFNQIMGSPGNGTPSATVFSGPAVAAVSMDWVPAIETFKRDGNLIVQADLPGLAVDDVAVEVEDGVLTISGERREEREVDDDGYRRTERRYGRFTRSIALPEGARTEEVQAAFRNGVLEISIPLAEQSQQQRRTVNIKSAPQNGGGTGNGGKQASASGGGSASS